MALKYTVKIDRKDKWFKQTIKNVVGDSQVRDASGIFFWAFNLENGKLKYVECSLVRDMEFGQERETVIHRNMQEEIGQTIPLKGK